MIAAVVRFPLPHGNTVQAATAMFERSAPNSWPARGRGDRIIAAVHESVPGPSRYLAATQQLSRFRSEADIGRFSVCADPVAFDPSRTLGLTRISAQLGRFSLASSPQSARI